LAHRGSERRQRLVELLLLLLVLLLLLLLLVVLLLLLLLVLIEIARHARSMEGATRVVGRRVRVVRRWALHRERHWLAGITVRHQGRVLLRGAAVLLLLLLVLRRRIRRRRHREDVVLVMRVRRRQVLITSRRWRHGASVGGGLGLGKRAKVHALGMHRTCSTRTPSNGTDTRHKR